MIHHQVENYNYIYFLILLSILMIQMPIILSKFFYPKDFSSLQLFNYLSLKILKMNKHVQLLIQFFIVSLHSSDLKFLIHSLLQHVFFQMLLKVDNAMIDDLMESQLKHIQMELQLKL